MITVDTSHLLVWKQNEDWASICSWVEQQNLLPKDMSPVAVKIIYSAVQKTQNVDGISVYLNYLLAQFPNNTTYLRDKGVLMQKQGDWQEGKKYFEQCVALRPDVLGYYGLLATAEFMLSNYARAIVHYKQALSDESKLNRAWLLRMARACFIEREYGLCQWAYEQALSLQEDSVLRAAYNEVIRIIKSNGSPNVSYQYYDEAFAVSEKYFKSAIDSIYVPVWQSIQELLSHHKVCSLLDLGCGPGQFAEFTLTHQNSIKYVGVDFSQVAINMALKRELNTNFICAQLPVENYCQFSDDFDCIVSTEVLEHIEHDIELIQSLPKGMLMIASVPNYDSFGHVRIFRDERSVRERYGKCFETLNIQPVFLSGNTIWLMYGRLA